VLPHGTLLIELPSIRSYCCSSRYMYDAACPISDGHQYNTYNYSLSHQGYARILLPRQRNYKVTEFTVTALEHPNKTTEKRQLTKTCVQARTSTQG
jgi:hypothetical protein